MTGVWKAWKGVYLCEICEVFLIHGGCSPSNAGQAKTGLSEKQLFVDLCDGDEKDGKKTQWKLAAVVIS